MFGVVTNHLFMRIIHYTCSTEFLLKIIIFYSFKSTNISRPILPQYQQWSKFKLQNENNYFPISKANNIHSNPFNFPENFYFLQILFQELGNVCSSFSIHFTHSSTSSSFSFYIINR